jgi:hypothetical protein
MPARDAQPMNDRTQPDFASRELPSLSAQFELFGRVEAPQLDSPLYAELCAGIANDEDLLEIAVHTAPTQPAPNMLLAAVHYLLLCGASHPLTAHYPSVSGAAAPGPAFPAFRDFCLARRAAIEQLVATRRTQTNVLRRCACLLPAFASVYSEADRPLALVEIGASAGLNLQWDRFGYRYSPGPSWGPADPPLWIEAEVRGDVPLPGLPERIPVAWRRGLDIAPIHVDDDDAIVWLRALIWPEHVDRHARLESAIDLARRSPPELVAGDATTTLPGAIAAAPQAAALCVFATHALYQFSRDARRQVYATMQRASEQRPVDFVSMEGTGDRCSELFWTRYRGGERTTRKLADSSHHGWWVEWCAA